MASHINPTPATLDAQAAQELAGACAALIASAQVIMTLGLESVAARHPGATISESADAHPLVAIDLEAMAVGIMLVGADGSRSVITEFRGACQASGAGI